MALGIACVMFKCDLFSSDFFSFEYRTGKGTHEGVKAGRIHNLCRKFISCKKCDSSKEERRTKPEKELC